MAIYKYKQFAPDIEKAIFVADSSDIIGRVELSSGVNAWFNTVIRGDVNKITIGENTNIQDLSMLHVTQEYELRIGRNVTIGHSVILHGCTIGDGSLIGMGAKILDGVVIGRNCLVAAGAVVAPGKIYEDNSFIIGVPGKVKRKLTDSEIELHSNHYLGYLKYAKEYGDENIFLKIKD